MDNLSLIHWVYKATFLAYLTFAIILIISNTTFYNITKLICQKQWKLENAKAYS